MMTKITDKSFCFLLTFLFTIIALFEAAAATPGLPFTEDFSADNLIDETKTTAELSTEEQSVRLALARTRFGALVDPPVVDISSDEDSTFAIAVGDVDGDGHLDFVAGNNGVNKLYLNTGLEEAPFADVVGVNISDDDDSTLSIALGDMDGDGDLDVVAGNHKFDKKSPNRLYLNNGTASPFSNVTGLNITDDSDETFSIALGDMDGDGDFDVVVGNNNFEGESKNRLYLNNGTANPFANVNGLNITDDDEDTSSIALGDVDGDGDLDVVAGHPSFGTNRLYLNNGTENPFADVTSLNITDDEAETNSIALGDMDGDGDLDVVIGVDDSIGFFFANRLYLNNGTADPFAGVTGSKITEDDDLTESIALGDVDGDGDLDVVAGNFPPGDSDTKGQNRLYLNNGTENPFFNVNGLTLTDHDNFVSITLGDVDGDGDLDVVAGNSRFANQIYLNESSANPPSNVTETTITDDDDFTESIDLGNMDSDGALDTDDILELSGDMSQTHLGRVVSLTIDDNTEPILSVILAAIADVPLNTHIDFYLSNNGGERWYQVVSDGPFVFPTSGSDLRWRAELRSLSPALTPALTSISITANSTPMEEPQAPTNLSATALSISSISLEWEDNSDNETGFLIDRKTGDGLFSELAVVDANITNYSDDDLQAETEYSYRVRAENSVGNSSYSNTATATTLDDGTPFPIALQGNNLPEQVTVELSVNKPSKPVAPARLILEVFDADKANEGALIINGNSPIPLFGKLMSKFNNHDRTIAPIEIITPPDWWQDGINTLEFIHTRTGGYRVESGFVEFNASSADFPLVLQGKELPEEATVVIAVSKPAEVPESVLLNLTVFDADKLNEGELIINGNDPIPLFGKLRSPENNRTTATIALSTPSEWWQDGDNTLWFIHTQSGGYRVESATVNFE